MTVGTSSNFVGEVGFASHSTSFVFSAGEVWNQAGLGTKDV